MYKSRYLISQDEMFTWLCLLILLIKINFLFNQTIIEIDTHIKLNEYNKRKKILCKVAHIRNKYYLNINIFYFKK